MTDTILVTGGAGYVGSHVVVELAKVGYAPVVLDNFATSTRAVLPRLAKVTGVEVPCIEADVRDVVVKLFDELGPRYKARPGGYLRILKFGFRVGDKAPMALVELVDRPAAESAETPAETKKAAKAAKAEKAAA